MAKHRRGAVSKQGLGTMIGLGSTVVLSLAPAAPAYTAPLASIVTGALAVWWAHKHYREGKVTASRKRRFIPVTATIVVVTLASVAWTWPSYPEIIVSEKYPGQWPDYTNTDFVPLDESAKFTMTQGQMKGIFPNVGGTENLTNVTLEMCVPPAFGVVLQRTPQERQGYATFAQDDINAQRHPDWTDCHQYTVRLGQITATGGPDNPNPLQLEAMSRRLLKFSGGSVVTRAPFLVRRPFSENASS